MTKRTFHLFSYQNCDSLTRYLSYMASQGWHFQKFGVFNSFLFEKGEPKEIAYQVDIFPGGRESDRVPSEEAKEYARYWEEAGWELADGTGKVCIYRQAREDAYEFQPPEVKLQQIRSAILKGTAGPFAILLAYVLLQVLTVADDPWYLADMLLDDNIFYIMVIFACGILIEAVRLVILMFRCRKWKALIESGGRPFYGNEKRKDGKDVIWSNLFRIIWSILVCAGLFGIQLKNRNYWTVVFFCVLLVIAFGAKAFMTIVRPARERMLMNVIGLIVAGCVLLLAFMPAMDRIDAAFSGQRLDAESIAFWTGIESEQGEITSSTFERSETLFGKRLTFEQEYGENSDSDYCRCELIVSQSKWIRDAFWNEEKEWMEDTEYRDVTKEWNAEEAYFDGSYHICSENWQMHLYLREDEKLSAEQIEVIKKKVSRYL